MGVILDGTYSAIDGLYRYFLSPEGRPAVQKIYSVSQQVASREKTADDGLEEIIDFLPEELGAAVKKLGSKNPVTAFLVMLAILSSIVAIGKEAASIYKTLSPDAPTPPSIVINNNPTIINQNAAGNGSEQSVTQGGAGQQRRQQERQETSQQQSARPPNKEAPPVTGSIAKQPQPKKLKARHARKKDRAARRREMNPRHKPNPICDGPA